MPSGAPFLPALARAVLAGDLPVGGGAPPDPLRLPRITILLPTRRACRALQDAFLDATGGRATLLPRIRPIGDTDEDGGFLRSLAGIAPLTGDDGAPLPPAVATLERHLVLTSLVLAWSRAMRKSAIAAGDAVVLSDAAPDLQETTPAQASHLAGELARLFDSVETEERDLANLAGLVPDAYSDHWQRTLDFLAIVTSQWPAYLEARAVMSPSARRRAMIDRMTADYQRSSSGDPVIVAGVTGSIPATARLMRAVSQLANGAVVVPGIDLTLAEPAWIAAGDGNPSHPQAGFRRLLEVLAVERSAIGWLPGSQPDAAATDRLWLLGEAMRPPSTTDAWAGLAGDACRQRIRSGLGGVSLIEARSADEEAEAVALILRHAAEQPGVSAALVSPDRLLARRVATRLESWGIRVDDSAGRPFGKTVPGAFLDLIADVVETRFSPVAVVSLLKHPLTRLGAAVAATRQAARTLELLAFRQPRLGDGANGIGAAIRRMRSAMGNGDSDERSLIAVPQPLRRKSADDFIAAEQLFERLVAAFAPLTELAAGEHRLASLAAAHAAVAEALAVDDNGSTDRLYAEEAGETAASLLAGLMDDSTPGPSISLTAYPEFYRSLIAGTAVRERRPVHPRLSIWGPFEARLMRPDIVVLGGLNDGTFPRIAEPDPWLNRPMLEALGLPAPEAAIGHEAHDFVELAACRRVYLTRATKVDGVPSVPSRWLMRLGALLDGLGLRRLLDPPADQPWLAWARRRQQSPVPVVIAAPRPTPPVAARPRQLSVTRIETWLANPYAIFARDILRLEPMPALGGDPDASLRGRLIHEAMNRFHRIHGVELPADAAAALARFADAAFAELAGHPRIAAFWQPRFRRFGEWFAATEPERRQGLVQLFSEVRGSLPIAGSAGVFKLTARADRIDLLADGSAALLDFKTGEPPSDKRVAAGLAPQLPLEALILAGGGFEGMAAAATSRLRYVKVSGGEPPGEDRLVKTEDPMALARAAGAGLARLIARFEQPETPYSALRRPVFAASYRYDDYAHLARVKEWATRADED